MEIVRFANQKRCGQSFPYVPICRNFTPGARKHPNTSGLFQKEHAMKHIRIAPFFIVLLAIAVQSLAQSSSTPSRFRAGISLGAVATDIPGTDTRDNDSDFKKLGFTFGALVSTELSAKNTLQLEINFTQKGAQQDPDTLNNDYFRLALNYIDVPLIFRHKLHLNIRRKPMDKLEIEAGASFDRLISYAYTDGTNYPRTVNPNTLNSTTASVLAGLNFHLTPHIYFTLRYSNSFIPALKRNSVPPAFYRYAYNSGNNQVVLFAVKYVFGLPKELRQKNTDTTTPPTDTPSPQ
jgi:hypothetical protein